MSSVQQLTDKILATAKVAADEFAAQAKAQEAAILQKANEQAAALEAEAQARAGIKSEEVRNRSLSVSDLESRKMQLAARQQAIDLAFDRALERLCDMDREQYTTLLSTMLVALVQSEKLESAEILLNERDAQIGEALLKQAQSALGAAGLSLSAERMSAKGGFVLRAGKVEYNNSMETVLAAQREALVPAVVAALFD